MIRAELVGGPPGRRRARRRRRVLNAAERVTILAGAGCQGAHDELIALAGALKAPIVHALRGKEFVEYDNPYDVGMTGLLGFESGYRAMEHCDALLMLGTDFPYRPFYPENARVVQVDIRGEHIGRRVPVDVALVGTVKDTIEALLPHLDSGRDATHLAGCARTTAAPASGSTRSRRATAIAGRSIRRRSRWRSTGSPRRTPCSSPTSARPTLWAARYLRMNGRGG
jgi:pyruvate dehydrogenase (quinone)